MLTFDEGNIPRLLPLLLPPWILLVYPLSLVYSPPSIIEQFRLSEELQYHVCDLTIETREKPFSVMVDSDTDVIIENVIRWMHKMCCVCDSEFTLIWDLWNEYVMSFMFQGYSDMSFTFWGYSFQREWVLCGLTREAVLCGEAFLCREAVVVYHILMGLLPPSFPPLQNGGPPSILGAEQLCLQQTHH